MWCYFAYAGIGRGGRSSRAFGVRHSFTELILSFCFALRAVSGNRAAAGKAERSLSWGNDTLVEDWFPVETNAVKKIRWCAKR